MLARSTDVLPPASQAILLRPDFADRLDIVTDSAVGLLRTHGPAGLTIRRIAGDCEMSVGWLTNQFANKDHLVSLVTATVGERWLSGSPVAWTRWGLWRCCPMTARRSRRCTSG